MTRWLETDSNTNIDISAATVVGSYTADADRLVVPQLLIDQAAGNGDYVYYAALQINGSGSWYVIGPKTTHAAASGETAIGAQGGAVAMRSGDVLRVYVDGLAGDTSTPDVVVRFFEYQPVREALATELGRVDAAVSSRLAAASYSAPPSASDNATAAAAAILAAADSDPISANVTLWKGDAVADAPPTAAAVADAVWATALPGAYGAGTAGKLLSDLPSAGAGAIAHTITVDDGTNPLDGAEVWISTDEAGSNVVAGTLSTDALGRVTFMLDAGTYWKHVQLAGYNFTAKAFTVA